MPALEVSLTADQLVKRMQDRLRGLSGAAPAAVLWQQAGSRVLIYVDSLQARVLPGWLLCNLDLQSDETGRQTLQVIFFLGSAGQGDGLRAGATIQSSTDGGARLAGIWGATLQRVLWDAVLDALEAFVGQSASKYSGQPVAIQGFQAGTNAFSAVMLAGDK